MAKKKDAKKFKMNNLVLARIKKLLRNYYEMIGKEEFEDWEEETKEVLYQISEAINEADISANALIMAEMEDRR